MYNKYNDDNKAYLLLEDGSLFEGYGFGASGEVCGEVVFCTTMVGCQQSLTDANYKGQILVQTFPIIGNYGINSYDSESENAGPCGYIVREWCELPSNFRMEQDINSFLKQKNIVGLYGIDTRKLTRILREKGTMKGIVTTDKNNLKQEIVTAYQPDTDAAKVSVSQPAVYNGDVADKPHLAVLDFGLRNSVRDYFVNSGLKVTVMPCSSTADDIKAVNADGVLISNGPGAPDTYSDAVNNIKEILKLGLPVFGVGLGHQLIALSQGAKCVKLLHGHRGCNQPVTDLERNMTFVTEQNHGYAVDLSGVEGAVVRFVNKNDSSCEGAYYPQLNAVTLQFYPEKLNCPQDSSYLYDEFISKMSK